MSSIVSRRPSSRNQPNDAFWMSIRFGRSRTCFRREKLLRAPGAAIVLLKFGASLLRRAETRVYGRNRIEYRKRRSLRKGNHAADRRKQRDYSAGGRKR